MALGHRAGCDIAMNRQKLGQNLQARARELGLSDAEVARRLGLGQSRYANYVSGLREPDFETFIKICRVLETEPNTMLEFVPLPQDQELTSLSLQRCMAALKGLNADSLHVAAYLLDALVSAQNDRK